jgi:predicted Zn-dependent peptidase
MEDVKAFYKKYYNPDNAILSVAGDVDADQIKTLSEKWFGTINKSSNLKNRNLPEEPEQTEPRTQSVERNVPQDAIYMAWHTGTRYQESFYHYDFISDILSNGDSSRLYQSLIKEKQLFSDINAFITGDLDKGLFIVSGKLMNGVSMETAETAIETELQKIQNELVEKQELEKIKNKVESNLVFSRLAALHKAMNLGYYEMLGDANLFNRETERYQQVTREDILTTSRQLFAPHRKNTLYYLKKK